MHSKETFVDFSEIKDEIRARAKISVTTYKIVVYDFRCEGSRSTHQEEI